MSSSDSSGVRTSGPQNGGYHLDSMSDASDWSPNPRPSSSRSPAFEQQRYGPSSRQPYGRGNQYGGSTGRPKSGSTSRNPDYRDGHPAVERELFRKPDHHQAAWERQPASWRTPERQSALHRRQGPSRGHADRGQASRERQPAPQKAPEYRPVPQRGGEFTGNPRNPSPSRLSSEIAILPTETVELKAWAGEMTAWARNAAAEIRTLKSEQETLQERVRRLEKTSKTRSATGEAKTRVEVLEDFQTPKKTTTAQRSDQPRQWDADAGQWQPSLETVIILKFRLLEHLWASPVLSDLPW